MSQATDDTVTATLTRVLGRLGAGEILRLRRLGSGATVEVLARSDGALEVPASVIGAGIASPHVLFGRHRVQELSKLLVGGISDLSLVTSSVVDGAGIERLLDGSGARSDIAKDQVLNRWDLPLVEQVRRFLAQRIGGSLSDFVPEEDGELRIQMRGVIVFIQPLEKARRIFIWTALADQLDVTLSLHNRLNELSHGRLIRLRLLKQVVLAEAVILAQPFIGQHLDTALGDFYRDAIDLTDVVTNEYGGNRCFPTRAQLQTNTDDTTTTREENV